MKEKYLIGIFAFALVGILLASNFAIAASGSNSETADSGMDSASDLSGDSSIDDSVGGVKLRGDGSVDDNGIDDINDNDVGEVKTRLSDGTIVEVELGIPLSVVTLEGKNIAVQKAKEISDGVIDRIEVAMEDGRIVWNVRIFTLDGKRIDVRIDDATKNLIRSRIESEGGISAEDIQTLDLSDKSGTNSNNEDNSDSSNSGSDNSRNGSEDKDFVLVRMWKSIIDFFKF